MENRIEWVSIGSQKNIWEPSFVSLSQSQSLSLSLSLTKEGSQMFFQLWIETYPIRFLIYEFYYKIFFLAAQSPAPRKYSPSKLQISFVFPHVKFSLHLSKRSCDAAVALQRCLFVGPSSIPGRGDIFYFIFSC